MYHPDNKFTIGKVAMSGQTFEKQSAIREAVKEYLDLYGLTSLRRIAEYVEEKTQIAPPASTIGRLVRKFGYDRKKVQWEKKK